MENIFLPNSKIVTRFDLGWTEDEYNDFMIDMWAAELKEETLPFEIIGEPITITITPKDYYNPST